MSGRARTTPELSKPPGGGGYTCYKLRKPGEALGFPVSCINGQVVINTNEPYSDAQ